MFSLKDAGLVQFHLTCCFPIQERPPTQIYAGHQGPSPAKRGWAMGLALLQDLGWCPDRGPALAAPPPQALHRSPPPLGLQKALGSELESRASCWAQDRSLGKDSGQGHSGNPGWAALLKPRAPGLVWRELVEKPCDNPF